MLKKVDYTLFLKFYNFVYIIIYNLIDFLFMLNIFSITSQLINIKLFILHNYINTKFFNIKKLIIKQILSIYNVKYYLYM